LAGLSALLLSVEATYIGCYVDGNERDLSHAPRHGKRWRMSEDACIAACKRDGYKYAGIQWGVECWCGNNYGRYGNASESTCNIICRGNKHHKCGGNWRNSVHTTEDCPKNQVYQKCGSNCPRQCNVEDQHCILMCVEGCSCPDDLPVMTEDGLCVTEENCPPNKTALHTGILWLRGGDSFIKMTRGNFLSTPRPVDYVGFRFKPHQTDAMLFFTGSSNDQYMALELVNHTLVAHWNFGFPNGSMEEAVLDTTDFTESDIPAVIKFGVSKKDHRVILSVNYEIAVNAQFDEMYTPNIIGDMFIGGLPPNAEQGEERTIPNLRQNYRGWIQDFQVNGFKEDAEEAIENVGVTVGQCHQDCEDAM